MSGYTVIDFETTGLSPNHHHRVIEVGVVYVSDSGEIQDSWSTLVNPNRDVGATSVHGITAEDLYEAPPFETVAPYLLRSVVGRTIVAHNARFDLRFLEAEFIRANMPLEYQIPGLCTMQWSKRFLPGASRKLSDCCLAAGVRHQGAHSALGDALATAGLLGTSIAGSGGSPPWTDVLDASSRYPWPHLIGDPPQINLTQRLPAQSPAPADAWLEQLTSSVGRVDEPSLEAYLEVLERALLDGHLSAHERTELIELASDLGLQREQVMQVHKTYLTALASAAWSDGVVTQEESNQLSEIAELLGVSETQAAEILQRSEANRSSIKLAELQLSPGDRVAFTGDSRQTRERWVARVEALGLTHGGVVKATRALVTADPDSFSSKAEKARSYGIPIITETAFERLISRMEAEKLSRRTSIYRDG